MEAVAGPLQSIAEHVKQAEPIRSEAADRGRIGITVAARRPRPGFCSGDDAFCSLVSDIGVAAEVGLLVTEPIPGIRAGLGPSPRSVFPFCLSHQAVGLASLARQPIGIRLGIVPIHPHHRMRPALGEPGGAPRTTPAILKLTAFERLALGAGIVSAFRHEGCELIDRDMKSADRKLPGECHIMLGAFLLAAIFFTLRRPHRKATRRPDHHLRALLQSLNTSPGPSAHSSSAESGTAVRDRIDTEIRPRPHGPDGTGDAVGATTAASLARGADGSSATGDARLVTSFRSSSFRSSSSRARAIDPYGVSPNWRTKSSNTAMLVVFCVASQTRPAGSTSTGGAAATVG